MVEVVAFPLLLVIFLLSLLDVLGGMPILYISLDTKM